MTSGVKTTIITPSFNQGKFIKRTIDSVLSQEIPNLEYLIFDGGSTDETVEILKSYGDRIIWTSAKDNGQADAVNKGLLQSTGDIIGWLNSDDIYYPEAIRNVLDVFQTNLQIDVIYGEADHIDEHDRVMEPYYTEEWNYERLKEICFICQPAVFFRKSAVDKYGMLDPKLRYCMDYEYWLRIGKDKSCYFLKRKLAGSRLYLDNKTLGNRRAVHEEIVSMMKERMEHVPAKWLYNLAHVLVEESGYNRDTAQNNREFVKKLIKTCCWLFIKHYNYIPLSELRNMYGWLSDAKSSPRG